MISEGQNEFTIFVINKIYSAVSINRTMVAEGRIIVLIILNNFNVFATEYKDP